MNDSEDPIGLDSVEGVESNHSGSDSNSPEGSGIRVLRMVRKPGFPVLDSGESEIDVMMADESNSMEVDPVFKRYVVLVASGEQLPAPLIELLSEQPDATAGSNVFEADHPLIAMALLSKLEGERRLRRKWEHHEQTVLVVVNRDSWKDLSGLFDATRELMPTVAIWVCAERIAIQIYAGEGMTGDAKSGHLAQEVEPQDDVPGIGHPSTENQDAPSPDRTTLSEEELQDLLGAFDDFEEDMDSEEEPRQQ